MNDDWRPGDNWHWDSDRRRWVCMRSTPTYNWSLKRDQDIYHNQSMLDAIEMCLDNMDRFPDAEKIIAGLEK